MSKYKNELEDMESIYLEPLVSEELDYKMNMQAKREEAKLEIAKSLLTQGIDIDIIAEATGLTKKQIQNL